MAKLIHYHIQTVVVIGFAALLPLPCDCIFRLFTLFRLRTSAAAAAALRASSPVPVCPPLLPPNVLGGPETLGFEDVPSALVVFATRAGTDAFVTGAGAEPRVRPGPWKLSSLDCLPQRLPIGSPSL